MQHTEILRMRKVIYFLTFAENIDLGLIDAVLTSTHDGKMLKIKIVDTH